MQNETIQLGDLAKDKITSFEGVVVTYSTYLHNGDRITLQPRELKDGQLQKCQTFDLCICQLLEKGVIEVQPPAEHDFKLGDYAKDQLSDCQGTIISLTNYLTGCTHAIIQSSQMKDGHPVDGIFYPVSQLELLENATVPASAQPKPGGPVREARAYLP